MTARPMGRDTGRVAVVDGLRGIASFAVCWYHLVFANGAFAGGGFLSTLLFNSARNAWVGVEVFFVISGFVVPYSLYRSNYHTRAYGTFLLKRIVRLDPPYLTSVALCLVLGYLSAHVHRLHSPPFHPSLPDILLHIGYLNAFAGKGWLNPVYWTLAIEFQYYLGLGLIFYALASRRRPLRLAAFILLGAAAFLIPSPVLVFHYLFLFMLGIVTFQHRVGLVRLPEYAVMLIVVGLGCYLTLGPMVTAIALLTALTIAFVRRTLRVLTFLGSISYSLYLVHVPVGGRVMDLLLPHAYSAPARVAVLALALGIAIVAAYALYLGVERPAQRWSSQVRYRKTRSRAAREPESGAVATGIAEP